MKLRTKSILFILISTPAILFAQIDSSLNGIAFEKENSWEQILKKAREENKYIFIDCYTTWCTPCKKMDKDVYTNKKVGEYINTRFISIKMQMNETKLDNEDIKQNYSAVNKLKKKYAVETFPTFLFLSPDGSPAHRASGFMNPEEFIALAADAYNPQKQYYKILQKFQDGALDTADMATIAHSIKRTDKELAGKIAAVYLENTSTHTAYNQTDLAFITEFQYNPRVLAIAVNYINNLNKIKLPKETLDFIISLKGNPEVKKTATTYITHLTTKELYSKEIIQFIANFTTSSKDKYFSLFSFHWKKVDSIMGQDHYAQDIVDHIIKNEEIIPYWTRSNSKNSDIPWKKITNIIKHKYNIHYARRIILEAKVTVYRYNADNYNTNWSEYIKYGIKQLDLYGTDTTNGFEDAIRLNNFCWNAILLHSTDKKQLSKAINWMEGVLRRHPKDEGYMDTLANLLYKVKRKEEAIRLEEQALELAIIGKDRHLENLFHATIEKMKNGAPTWVDE